ncbi:TetR/AcrR family transcriptional regulator, partial [Streptomyces sp. TRM76130]|nr:TetR/AcrR family transcriptional regulator [Streptomyces sp. TRM76130]
EQMSAFLRQARAAGEVTTATPDGHIVDTLLTALIGFQVNALLAPRAAGAQRQEAVLDVLLGTFA